MVDTSAEKGGQSVAWRYWKCSFFQRRDQFSLATTVKSDFWDTVTEMTSDFAFCLAFRFSFIAPREPNKFNTDQVGTERFGDKRNYAVATWS